MIDSLVSRKQELAKLPEGYLVYRNGCYYHRINGKETGISKNTVLIRKLARKHFLQKEIPIIENNEKLLKKCADNYMPIVPQKIIEKMSKAYRSLPHDYFFNIRDFGVHQSENPYKCEKLIYCSNGGVYVRTKSELIIANFLEAHGIMYWYETKFLLGGRWIYPDFMVDRPNDHNIIPLEHLGMLGDPEYDKYNKQKLKDYIDNDYFPGYNLICTYEQDIMEPGRLKAILQQFGIV